MKAELVRILCILTVLSLAGNGADASLRSVRRMYREKKYDDAREALVRELQSYKGKSRSEGLLLLARLETEIDGAATIYRQVISTGRVKYRLKAKLELAKIQYSAGEYRKAIETLSFLPAKGYSGDRLAAVYFRALCWKQLGEFERARADLSRIDRGDYLYWSYMSMAEIDVREGRIEEAIDRYETIGSSHWNPIAGFNLGECYEILGERDKALKVYRTLMRQFPGSLETPRAREKIQMIRYSNDEQTRKRPAGGGNEETAGEGAELADMPRFTLQFGAFSERENAIRLAKELEAETTGMRVERVERDGRIWHRVRVGSFTDRSEAERLSERIRNNTGYSSTILPLE